MQEVFEKIIERLRTEKNTDRSRVYSAEQCDAIRYSFGAAIDVVKVAAAEHNKDNYFNLDKVTLHKCPVCGGAAEHRVNQRGRWACGCFKCKVFKFNYNHEKAIQAWEDFCTEYNNGWIPCNERLPEDDHSVLICGESGYIDSGWYKDGRWWTGFSFADIMKDIIAWQPLPEPYRPKECE